MRPTLTILVSVLFICYATSAQQQTIRKKKVIIIEGKTSPGFSGDSLELEFIPVDQVKIGLESIPVRQSRGGNIPRLFFYPERSGYIISKTFFGTQKTGWFAEPGDSVRIDIDDKKINFSGNGADKYNLQYKMEIVLDSITKPRNFSRNPLSFTLEDYYQWTVYLDKQLQAVLSVIESYKNKVSQHAYERIKASFVSTLESLRLDKFWSLCAMSRKMELTNQDICRIYDSTMNSPADSWLQSLPNGYGNTDYYYDKISKEIYRQFGFDFEGQENLHNGAKRKLAYYELAKKKYKGRTLEDCLLKLIITRTIEKNGFVPETEQMLADYYSRPGFPEHRKLVKEYERVLRTLEGGKPAPGFSLIDKDGKIFTKEMFKGKVALMDFWFTGCVGCIQMTPAIRSIEERFKGDTNVVFLSISTDVKRSAWIKSIAEQKYTTGNGINLYTGGQGVLHPMIKTYNVNSYPELFLLDGFGNIVQNPLPGPRRDTGRALSNLIERSLVAMNDGPYVLYDQDFIHVYSIKDNDIDKKKLSKTEAPVLDIQTDKPDKKIRISLKKSLKIEPSEYPKPSNLFVMSDIEGNFEAMRKLLQANKIIDEDYNWTFGDGHLVFNGDVFDRGEQVTECLWLIYSLEEKAKVAGGYVHFILGNHEIMNLSGDIRYVIEKYKVYIEKMGKSYTELYGKNSELGRWLRTKNIMEKIGDILFIHAGISKEVNDLALTPLQINDLVRDYIDKDSHAKKSGNKNLALLFDSKLSPFWYRLYYQETEVKRYTNGMVVYKASNTQIDDTFKKFKVSRIVTGHTIIADTISVHYDGKVINTNTKHAEGKSEALLVEDDRYYRVNITGEKMFLFRSSHDYSAFHGLKK